MTDTKIVRGSVGTRNFNIALTIIMILTVGAGAYIFDIYNKQAAEMFGFETSKIHHVSADLEKEATEVPAK